MPSGPPVGPGGRSRAGRRVAAAAVVLGLAGLLLALPGVLAPLAGGRSDQDPVGAGATLGTAHGPPAWEQVLAIRDDLRRAAASPDYPVDAAQLAAVATTPGPYTPLGRIAFPTTGLDVEFGSGVQPSVLERGPGHWTGTALPGQPGNAVVSGHRTTYTAPFGDLDLLVAGDPIVVTGTGATAPSTYRVVETSVLPEAEYAAFVLRQPADPTARELTLFACTPKGQRTHRIVVRAVMSAAGDGRGGAPSNEEG